MSESEPMVKRDAAGNLSFCGVPIVTAPVKQSLLITKSPDGVLRVHGEPGKSVYDAIVEQLTRDFEAQVEREEIKFVLYHDVRARVWVPESGSFGGEKGE